MKHFIIRLVAFASPLLLICASVEMLVRRIPNEYEYKHSLIEARKDGIELLFLGSSHALYGINPEFLQRPGLNGAHVSQSLNIDLAIMEKYFSDAKRLKLIAIPISYFTLFSTLESGPEKWRAKNYAIYYGIRGGHGLGDYLELLGNNPRVLWKRIRKYYLKHQRDGLCACSPLGYGLGYDSSTKVDLDASGLASAKRHSTHSGEHLAENTNTLVKIIEFARERNLKVLLYTPPAYKTYVQHLDANQLQPTLSVPAELARQYDNVTYIDFMANPAFVAEDFHDADHLNEIGAKKFTCMLDDLIEPLLKDGH